MSGDRIEREKRAKLSSLLRTDPLAADLTWSIFRAACEDYRFDSLLEPCPPTYRDETGEKLINRLRVVSALVRSIPETLNELEEGSINDEVLFLLHWVLCEHSYKIKTVKKSEFQSILEKVQKCDGSTCFPSYIFRVDVNERPDAELFQQLAQQWGGTTFAFHGSRFENFHSILHNGLKISRERIGAFGQGIYLSSALSLSLHYSPTGMGWGGSALGTAVSIVALCEMVNHEDVTIHTALPDHARAKRSRDGVLPKGYFLVKDSPNVRVTHLLVYARRSTNSPRWTRLLLYLMAAYFLMILFMALYKHYMYADS